MRPSGVVKEANEASLLVAARLGSVIANKWQMKKHIHTIFEYTLKILMAGFKVEVGIYSVGLNIASWYLRCDVIQTAPMYLYVAHMKNYAPTAFACTRELFHRIQYFCHVTKPAELATSYIHWFHGNEQ